MLPEQKQALKEMALALAEMARDRAIAAMVNYINQISLADLAILQTAHAQLRATAPPARLRPERPLRHRRVHRPRLRQNASEEASPLRGGLRGSSKERERFISPGAPKASLRPAAATYARGTSAYPR